MISVSPEVNAIVWRDGWRSGAGLSNCSSTQPTEFAFEINVVFFYSYVITVTFFAF